MKEEYDFSKGERGKFYRENVNLNIPIYLEPDIRKFVETVASKKGMDVETIVNKMIKRNSNRSVIATKKHKKHKIENK